MNLAIWFVWYKEILEEFGFKREDDEKSAEILNHLLKDSYCLSPPDIPLKSNVIVFGAGPSLKNNIKDLKKLNLSDFSVIAADGATTALLEEKIIPDIIVTDLDGKMEDIIQANRGGSFLVVHAHGNNMEKINKYFHNLKKVLGTTQSIPLENVYNFGGFTDGDRALFLAAELGAKCIIMAGMDFGKIITRYSRPNLIQNQCQADAVKEKKLEYAKKLVNWLAHHEKVNILNISDGEKVDGVLTVNLEDLKKYFKNLV